MRRGLLWLMGLLLLCDGSVWAKEVEIHGFVTSVTSVTSSEIDEYKISRDQQLLLEVEKDDSGIATASFTPDDIRVGTELEIRGEWNEVSGELKAKSIKVFLVRTK